jgi:acyl carrier protein
MDDLRKALRRALTSRFGVRVPLTDDTELFSRGLIDSLNVVELVTFVEGELGRPIPPADITLDNFDSIDRIARYAGRTGGTP